MSKPNALLVRMPPLRFGALPHTLAAVVAVAFTLIAPLPAPAASAPILPLAMASSTNDLQRAVWACEAAAPSLSKPGSADGTRFFLGTVENTPPQAEKPPLLLLGLRLLGFGQISNNQGWFNIRFDCALRPDFMQAKEFNAALLGPARVTEPSSVQPSLAPAPMRWSVTGATSLQLVHAAGQTWDFRATCVRSSGLIEIHLPHSLQRLEPGNFFVTSITDGPGSALYVAQTGSGTADAALPGFAIQAADPLWRWIGPGKSLHINLGGEVVYDVNQDDSGKVLAGFLQACR